MWKLTLLIRYWFDCRFGRRTRFSPHDEGVVRKLPWLKLLIPLGKWVSSPGSSQQAIRFNTIDQIAQGSFYNRRYTLARYLVTRSGNVLAAVGRHPGNDQWEQPILLALSKLGSREAEVAYLVAVLYASDVDMVIYKFPSEKTSRISLIADRAKLLRERAAAEAEARAKDHEKERLKGEQEAAEAA